jgi:5'(3')-deoxyribonucleotidase
MSNHTDIKPVVAIDCDGVLADWMGYVIPAANILFNTNISLSDLTGWDLYDIISEPKAKTTLYDYLNQTKMILDMNPYEEALRGMLALKEFAEIYIVTSPMVNYPNWILHRNKWLKTHFGIDKNHVIHTAAKQLIQADVFIDDKPENVINWAKYKNNALDGYPVLWKHDHIKFELPQRDYFYSPEDKITHTNDWNEILKMTKHVHGLMNGELPF